MKGMVFKELLSMVEQNFGEEFADDLIDSLQLDSDGAYTSVGTYDHSEILAIVTKLSEKTGADSRDLVKAFGKHLLATFFKIHPEYFQVESASAFLSSVDQFIHIEVKKLYPDAELPKLDFSEVNDTTISIAYESKRPFADLAEGLIEMTFEHFKENVSIETTDLANKTQRTFTITKDAVN